MLGWCCDTVGPAYNGTLYTGATSSLSAWQRCACWQAVWPAWVPTTEPLRRCRKPRFERWTSLARSEGSLRYGACSGVLLCGIVALHTGGCCMMVVGHGRLRGANRCMWFALCGLRCCMVSSHRLACAAVLSAIGCAGAVGIWANGAALFNEAVAVCTTALDDPSASVRAAFASALGQLAAAAQSDAAQVGGVGGRARVCVGQSYCTCCCVMLPCNAAGHCSRIE